MKHTELNAIFNAEKEINYGQKMPDFWGQTWYKICIYYLLFRGLATLAGSGKHDQESCGTLKTTPLIVA